MRNVLLSHRPRGEVSRPLVEEVAPVLQIQSDFPLYQRELCAVGGHREQRRRIVGMTFVAKSVAVEERLVNARKGIPRPLGQGRKGARDGGL